MAVVLSLASDGGIHSAAVAVNGNVVSFATEQVSDFGNFPSDLLEFCLERADIKIEDIDQIVCSESKLDALAERWRGISAASGPKQLYKQAKALTSSLFDDSNLRLSKQIKRKNSRAILDRFEPCKLILQHAHEQSPCKGALVYRLQDSEIIASIWHHSDNNWHLTAPPSASQTPFSKLYQAADFHCNTPEDAIQLTRIQAQPEQHNTMFIRQSETGFAELAQGRNLSISQLFCALDQAIKADLRYAQKVLQSKEINIVFDGPNLAACLNQSEHIIHQEWVSAITLLEQVLTFKPEKTADIWNEDQIELWLNDHCIRYRYCDEERIENMIENALSNRQSVAKINYKDTNGSAFMGELITINGHSDMSTILAHKRGTTPSDLLSIGVEQKIDILACGNFWIELTDAKLYRIH